MTLTELFTSRTFCRSLAVWLKVAIVCGGVGCVLKALKIPYHEVLLAPFMITLAIMMVGLSIGMMMLVIKGLEEDDDGH